MSSDGCIEVAWKGQAFPYLMHHPVDPARSESYGSAKESSRIQEPRKVAAGVWDGRAPQGFLAASDHGKVLKPTPSPRKIPRQAILGRLRMPMLVLDTAGLSGDMLQKCLDTGYRGLLCSTGSSNLADIGATLSQSTDAKGSTFLCVQVSGDTAPKDAAGTIKATMSALGVSKIDLVVAQTSASISDTWAALESLVEAGAVQALGLAGATLEQTSELMEGCKIKPVANFMELHPMKSERKTVGQLMRKGVQAVAVLPTGGAAGAALQQSDPVVKVAKEAGHAASEVLLKWSTQRGTPVVVDSATVALQSFDVEGFFDWRMSEERHKVVLDAMNEDKSFA